MTEENGRITVTLKRGTTISGRQHQAGDEVEVYPFQYRQMVAGGYVEGGYEDAASPAEIEQGNLEALKYPEEREGYIPEAELWERGYGVGSGEGAA